MNDTMAIQHIDEVGRFGIPRSLAWKEDHWVSTSGSPVRSSEYSATNQVSLMIRSAVLETDKILLRMTR
jgi:hypothetical protein